MSKPPTIPDFTLVRPLGRGGFGEVWLGRSLTGVHRAVKTIERSAHPDVEFEGVRVYERRVTDHDHLIDIRHVGETETHLYYVMELADGYAEAPTFSADDYEPRTLESELSRRGHLPEKEALAIAADIARGLAHLHSLGLLHRDVKPANIVFVDGRAKLADLGLVGKSDGAAAPGLTPSYAPPEGVVGPDGDLYCLGRVLFEMLSGAPASDFPAFPPDADPARIEAIGRAIPVVDRACAPNRADRYTDAEAFLQAITPEGSAIGDASSPPRPAARTSSGLLGLVGRAAALILGLGLIWAAVERPWRSEASIGSATATALEVLFKIDAHDHAAQRLSAESGPLFTGDVVALEVELPAPEYLVVAQLERPEPGGAIEVTILNDTAGTAAVDRWRGPHDPHEWWPLGPPEGTLVFVLLGSDRPVDDLAAVERDLASIGTLPHLAHRDLLRLRGAQLEVETGLGGRLRGIEDPARTVRSRDGGLESLAETLGDRFHRIEALAVPQVANVSATP